MPEPTPLSDADRLPLLAMLVDGLPAGWRLRVGRKNPRALWAEHESLPHGGVDVGQVATAGLAALVVEAVNETQPVVCSDCRCVFQDHEWCCWNCGAGRPDPDETDPPAGPPPAAQEPPAAPDAAAATVIREAIALVRGWQSSAAVDGRRLTAAVEAMQAGTANLGVTSHQLATEPPATKETE